MQSCSYFVWKLNKWYSTLEFLFSEFPKVFITDFFQNTFGMQHSKLLRKFEIIKKNIFFYCGFLPWTLTIHRTSEEECFLFIITLVISSYFKSLNKLKDFFKPFDRNRKLFWIGSFIFWWLTKVCEDLD